MYLARDLADLLLRPFTALARLRTERRPADGLRALILALGLPMLVAELAAAGPYRPPQGLSALPADSRSLADAFSLWFYRQRFVLPLYDFAAGLLLWLAAAGLIHLVARRLGGRGTFPGYLTLVGYVALVGLVALPLSLLQAILRNMGTDSAAAFSAPITILALLLFAWENVLLIQGARLHHGISMERAVSAVVGPVVGLAVLLVLLAVVAAVLGLMATRL